MFIFGGVVGSVITICYLRPDIPKKAVVAIKKKYKEYCDNQLQVGKTE